MTEETYIKEKQLLNQTQAIPTKEMFILLNIIKTHICKIYLKDNSHGTGFFCNIPNGWGNYLTVLMTNNHVLNQQDIQPGQVIKFTIDNDYKEFNILIDNNRKTYTDESYDVTIIEIKEEDDVNEKSFFDLDKQIFDENVSEIFRSHQVYLLHYPKGKEMELSPGLIKIIKEDNKTIQHLCDTSGGSSGSPIVNKNNFQVIGIHKGASDRGKNYNLGTLLKEPVKKFNELIKMKKNNIDKKINNINNNNNYNKENERNLENEEKRGEIDEENGRNNEIEEKMEEINEQNERNLEIEEKREEIDEENKRNNEIEEKREEINEQNERNLEIEEKRGEINEKNERNLETEVKREIIKEENEKIEINKNLENMNDKKKIEENTELIVNSNDDNINEIILRYKIDNIKKLKDIRILGDKFVKNNKNICKIVINGNEFEICKKININLNQLKNNIFEIKLKGIKNVTNMSYIFNKCNSLSPLSEISKWNTQNVTDMSYMFFYCESLVTLPEISNWNTKNVTNMIYMFYNCSSLSSLPDISKWNTQNVTDMSFMFDKCNSLLSLPDISKWNTQNVTTMRFMFCDCKSLLSLPDISKWNTQNVTTMENTFAYCKSLSSLPDISKCNTEKVSSFYNTFVGCNKKLNFPKKFKSGCFIF